MNPFHLNPFCSRPQDVAPPDEQQTSIRTMRLIEDLRLIAAELETDQWASVAIVQSPDRLQVSTHGGTSAHVTPLLAASLLAALEQTILAGELVRSKLAPEWRQRLLGAG